MVLDTMKKRIQGNWKNALIEVGTSIGGTLGMVFVIALIVSQQEIEANVYTLFAGYFEGGQISLPILSLSGIIILALLGKHKEASPELVRVVSVVFLLPIVGTAIMIGMNPGFRPGGLGPGNLMTLWAIYGAFHLLWFLVLILEPVAYSIEEADKDREQRIRNMMSAGDTGRG